MEGKKSNMLALISGGQESGLTPEQEGSIQNLLSHKILKIDSFSEAAFISPFLWDSLGEEEKRNISKKICSYLSNQNNFGNDKCTIKALPSGKTLAEIEKDNFKLI